MGEFNWLEIVQTLLTAFGGIGGALLVHWLSRRKTKAEVTGLLVDSSVDIIGQLRLRIVDLEKEILELKKINKELRIEIDKLKGCNG